MRPFRKMRRNPDCLHGTLLKGGTVAGFTLTETAYAPGLRLPAHVHQSTYLCFVLQGRFTEFYGRGSRSCRPSTLIFRPAGDRHSDHFHTPARCFNLSIPVCWLERTGRQSALGGAAFPGGVLPHLAMKVYREFRQADDVSPLIVEGLMFEIFGEALRQSTRRPGPTPPDWLVRARAMLRDRFREDFSLAALAEEAGVHETHLAREFRRHYRCTAGEYVRRLRVEFACRRLRASDDPLCEVAQASGFFDQSHFGRTFKRHTGMSPAAYRKTFRAR